MPKGGVLPALSLFYFLFRATEWAELALCKPLRRPYEKKETGAMSAAAAPTFLTDTRSADEAGLLRIDSQAGA